MSTRGAMSGAFATIFSFEKSRKWIIREGRKGISRRGSGASDGQRLEEVSRVAHAGRNLPTGLGFGVGEAPQWMA